MTVINSLQTAPAKERQDVNFNVQAQYIPRDDQVDLKNKTTLHELHGGFSSASRRVKLHLRRIEPKPLPNIIYNADLAPVEGTPAAYSAGPARDSAAIDTWSTGTAKADEAETKAIQAAEDVLLEVENEIAVLKDGQWIVTGEDGFQYIDPDFYVHMENIISLFNLLQLLGMIIDAMRALKENIISFLLATDGKPARSEGQTASEVIGQARETGMLTAQGQLQTMTDEVLIHNQEVIETAIREAEEEASGNGWSWFADIISSGGAQAVTRDKAAQVARASYAISQKYESFMSGVQELYDAKLGDSELYNDGLTQLGDVFSRLTWNNLTVDIGGRKIDVDRDKLLASQMALVDMENFRTVYFLYTEALQELYNLVIEGATGMRITKGTRQMLMQMIESLKSFESMVFSAYSFQLQSAIAAHNQEVDAYDQKELAEGLYLSSALPLVGGAVPFVGGLSKNISDWIFLETYYAGTDDETNPTQLDMDRVYTHLADLLGVSQEQLRREVYSTDEDVQRINELEREEWEIIGRLNAEAVVYRADDGLYGMQEAAVNDLRETLTRKQNTELALIMKVEAQIKLSKIVIKFMTDQGEIEVSDEAIAAMKDGLESRKSAFDLKLAGLKNKMEADNKQIQQQKTLSKARAVGIGSVFGMALAGVILILGAIGAIPSGGTSLVGAIGLVAAMGQLGAALGSIVWNSLNDIDSTIYDRTEFYLEEAEDSTEQLYNEQLDALDEDTHITAEDRALAADQWAIDTEELMRVRAEMTRIYLYEKLVLMYIKAFNDLNSLALTPLTGYFTGEDYEFSQESSRNRYEQKLKAFGLKKEMIEQIISLRNQDAAQANDTSWAVVSAILSVISIVAAGVGAAGSEAVQEAAEWVQWSAQIANMLVQITKSITEATSGYGELAEFNSIENLIDEMVGNALDGESAQRLRDALASVREEKMSVEIGAGRATVDGAQYYNSVREMQQMYDRVIIMLRVAEAIVKMRAKIVGAPVVTGASEALSEEKANFLEQLDLLNDRVQTYIARTNAMADATRELAISIAMLALEVILKILEKTETLKNLKADIMESFDVEKYELIDFSDNDTLNNAIAQMTSGDPYATGDGKMTVGNLLVVLLDILISRQLWRNTLTWIHDAGFEVDEKVDPDNLEKLADKESVANAAPASQALSAGQDGDFARVREQQAASYESYFTTAQLSMISDRLQLENLFDDEARALLNDKLETLINGINYKITKTKVTDADVNVSLTEVEKEDARRIAEAAAVSGGGK